MQTARLAVALSSLALATLVASPAGAADAPPPATLTVVGHGTSSQAPDRTQVAFRIETTSADSAQSASANSAIANAVTAKMRGLGIPPSGIATTGYGLNYVPRPSRPDPGNDQRYGYTTYRTIAVTVDGIDRAGAIVDAGVAAGATNVDGITFTLRDQHAAQRAAQSLALADAVEQARALANAAGVRLVRILSIAPSSNGVGPRPFVMARMAAAAPVVPTTIDAGALTLDADVTLRYEIAPARP